MRSLTLPASFALWSIAVQIEGPDGLAKYERLLFSNIDDGTGAMLDTIVRKVRFRLRCNDAPLQLWPSVP